jgi:hypothetical protein
VTDAPSIYQKCRTDIATMLGCDLDALTPEQATRLDIATALRVLLDNQSGRLLRGESLDARELLMASDALAKILPPLAEPPPAARREDPREYMWRTYVDARRRSQIPEEGLTAAKITALESEVAQLKAQLAGLPDVPTLVETVPVPAPAPAGENVVPLPRPNPPAAPAAPQYDYNANQDWKNFVNPDSSIRSTPRGRWDV